MSFLQLLINTVALGAAYSLIALGFVWVLNATNAVNFAHGDMVMAGGFASLALAALLPVLGLGSVLGSLPGIVLLPLVLILMAAFGLVFSGLAYFPLKDRPPVAVFISTIALGIMVTNGANALFGAEPRATPPLFAGGVIALGGLIVSRQSIAVIVVAALLIAGQHGLFAWTQFGRKLRATAQDREMAAAVGIPVNRMIALTFALATALAGAAGLLLSNSFFVTPADGMNYMVKAYIAVTIGGWGSIAGAVAGAFLIALFDVMLPGLPALLPALNALPGADWLFSQTVATILLYLLLLAILLLRPQGLFGEAVQRRA